MVWTLQAPTALTESQFVRWSKLLEERTGIQLSAQQKALLQSQVTMRMRELGYSDYNQYYQLVIDGLSDLMEWSVFVVRLTVKETSIFSLRPSLVSLRRLFQ